MVRSLHIRFLLTLTFLFIVSVLPGQNLNSIDNLRQKLRSASGEEKFDLLNQIGFAYRYSFPDSTIYYCNSAYALGKELKLTKDLSKPLSFIGLASAYRGDFKNSVKYHQEAIEVAAAQNDSLQLAHGYNNFGRMFADQGDMVRAYNSFIRSLTIFTVIKDKSGLAYVYRSFANFYKAQHDYSKALTNSLKALELRRKLGEPRAIVSALFELGLVYQEINEKDEALASFREADSIATRVNDQVTIAELRLGMSEILFVEGKLDRALILAQNVLAVVSEKTNQELFLRATLIRAKYAFQKKQDDASIGLFNRILNFSEVSGNLSYQRESLFYLAKLFKKKRNLTLANDYTQRYALIQTKLQTDDLTRQIDRLQFQLEIEKKEKENELLKAEEAKNLALIFNQRILNIGLVISIALLAALASVTLISSQKRKKINRKLELQNQHIAEQRAEIAQQNEKLFRRNRELDDINREKDVLMSIVAHDLKSPMNRIYGLTSLMEADGGVNSSQEEYLKLLKDSVRSGLDLITDLLDVNSLKEVKDRPSYGTVRLKELVDARIQSFQQAADTKSIRLSIKNDSDITIISERNYITRLLDNLISNAIKFSPPRTEVSIRASHEDGKLILVVKDQGPGFSPEDRSAMYQRFKKLSARPTAGESSNGLGLAIVKILVERLQGDITLNSEPGHGSEFIIHIPVSVIENISS